MKSVKGEAYGSKKGNYLPKYNEKLTFTIKKEYVVLDYFFLWLVCIIWNPAF